jgi:hypothetical protein
MLERLDEACKRFDYETVRALLLRVVSEYAPQCGIEDFIWSAQRARAVPPPAARMRAVK